MARNRKLTANEKRVISATAAKGYKFFTGKKITSEERAAFLALAEGLKNRKNVTFGKEAIALWTARVNYAIARKDKKNVRKLVTAPFEPEAIRAAGAGVVTSARVGRIGETQFWDDDGGCSCTNTSW